MGVDDMQDLEKKLNYSFRDPALLEEAVSYTHLTLPTIAEV